MIIKRVKKGIILLGKTITKIFLLNHNIITYFFFCVVAAVQKKVKKLVTAKIFFFHTKIFLI